MTTTEKPSAPPHHGPAMDGRSVTFSVWAPRQKALRLSVEGGEDRPMDRREGGWFSLTLPLEDAPEGTLYGFRLDDGRLVPDPASRYQPDGVHGRSMLVDLGGLAFAHDGFKGVPLEQMVLDEIHVGTFTPEGTLDAAIGRLPLLAELGINGVELMPLAAFDGERGWGYDGVQPFAVHRAYGGPLALARFVDAAHALGISVLLDVVYNHFGPSGCYESLLAPWFAAQVKTPWGPAIDFSQPAVRSYVVQNALFWLSTFHLDGLRLDAVHAIQDPTSSRHVLAELSQAVDAMPPTRQGALKPILIGESHLNDSAYVMPVDDGDGREGGGMGLDSQWSDDLHHALHALLTGEKAGYYSDYGELCHVAAALRDGQTYVGQHSDLWKGPHGTPTAGLPGSAFVVFGQNHDQVGNRPWGNRLSTQLDLPRLKLLAAAAVLSPFVPMLFMGESWGEDAPFPFFTGFPDGEGLGRAVERGRMAGFKGFGWQRELPSGWEARVPPPQAEATFMGAKVHPEKRLRGMGKELWDWYAALVAVRKSFQRFTAARVGAPPAGDIHVEEEGNAIAVHRRIDGADTLLALNFSGGEETVFLIPGKWKVLADSQSPTRRKSRGGVLKPVATIDVSDPGAEVELMPWQALFARRSP